MNRMTYLRRELAIATRRLANASDDARLAQDGLAREAIAAAETVAEMDAAVVELEYQNALLTLGITEG